MPRLIAPFLIILALGLPGGIAAQDAMQAAKVAADFVGAAPVEPLPDPIPAGIEAIRAPALAAHIAFLAAPSMEGRGLGGRGLGAAIEYAAAGLALAGIAPLDQSGQASAPGIAYFQEVPLREIGDFTGQITIERRRGGEIIRRTFSSCVDCLFSETSNQSISAPVVFAGYGIREPALGRDDYAGLDVHGKTVIIRGGTPPGDSWQTPEMQARYAAEDVDDRYETKLEVAKAQGAVAVLAIDGEDWAKLVAAVEPAEQHFFLPFDEADLDHEPPLVRVSPAVSSFFLATDSADSAASGDKPHSLPGVTVEIQVGGQERLAASRNVLGCISGSDPHLRDEAVIIGAHIDHLGQTGGVFYPGADDNASGVAALLEIAKAFATGTHKPKRTLILAFWTGEEEGHLGSGYYVRHPLWPLARTSVYLNLDMIGHAWSMDEIRKLVVDSGLANGEDFLAHVQPADFVEPGVANWAPELADVLRRAGLGIGLTMHFDRIDGKHGGSDYREFARAGIPWIRFFGNFFPGYHEPTDTLDKLDPAQVQKMARLCFATAYQLADR